MLFFSSTGFAEGQAGPHEHAASLPSKLLETFKSSGVATLSLGPVWESAGNTQTFYLAPNIEKTYAANPMILAIRRPLARRLLCLIL